jgi:hypothetical protein
MPEGQKDRFKNRLQFEKSPYLLQHAGNPVDWYAWGSDAFEKAKREDKPVFLSIGYSTCHWCHVMAHESFEDHDVASLMNKAFVSIKVDREERPDIDSIYMRVCQMLTQSGGWPLNVIMTHDGRPFFAATYIPRNTRYGRAGMLQLIPRVMKLWRTQRNDLLESAGRISAALQQTASTAEGDTPGEHVLNAAFEALASRYDGKDGGFSGAPKFPTPHNYLFLLRYWKRTGDQKALEMVEHTLQRMRRGGIYDHIGFGFHRYSTDSRWLVPHFEKMLYDQAMLTMAFVEAYQATGKEIYKKTAEEIAHYVLRDMTGPEGGFYTAEDADAEGKEGKFYLWKADEIRALLGKENADLFIDVFNIVEEGNFNDESTGRRTGMNILHRTESVSSLAARWSLSQVDFLGQLESSRRALFSYREKRTHPLKDDKILADWNGLMIASLAKASSTFDEEEYRRAACRAADFVLGTMRTRDDGLYHRYRDGCSGIRATLDDYAFMIWGLMELYEATFDVKYLREALSLNSYLLAHFWDQKQGGFYSTADDAENLLLRPRETYDGAIPSGNSVAALNLLRLGRATGNSELDDKAACMMRAFSRELTRIPDAHTQFMVALEFSVSAPLEIVIAGDSKAKDTAEMRAAIDRIYLPYRVLLLHPTEVESPEIETIAEFTKNQIGIEGKATAYVCSNYRCTQPVTSVDEMIALLHRLHR